MFLMLKNAVLSIRFCTRNRIKDVVFVGIAPRLHQDCQHIEFTFAYTNKFYLLAKLYIFCPNCSFCCIKITTSLQQVHRKITPSLPKGFNDFFRITTVRLR